MKIKLILLIGALFILQCSSLTVPELNNNSGVGIGFIDFYESAVFDELYFVLLDGNDNMIYGDTLIPSNYNISDYQFITRYQRYYYLLNIKPGKYALAFGYKKAAGEQSGYYYLFPVEIIKSTIVDIKAGEVVFMGDYKVRIDRWNLYEDLDLKNFDEAQLYYINLRDPGRAQKTPLARFFTRSDYSYKRVHLEKIEKNKNAETAFFERSAKELSNSKWRSLFLSRLNELNK